MYVSEHAAFAACSISSAAVLMIVADSYPDTLVALLRPRIIRTFHRVGTPLFLGEVASEVNRGLEQTLLAVTALVNEGVLRPAAPDEIAARLGVPGSNVYVLVGSSKTSLAFAG